MTAFILFTLLNMTAIVIHHRRMTKKLKSMQHTIARNATYNADAVVQKLTSEKTP